MSAKSEAAKAKREAATAKMAARHKALAADYRRAADELERIGFVEDKERRRAIQAGAGLLRWWADQEEELEWLK